MSSKKTSGLSRRDVIKTGGIAAAGALAGVPFVHAQENNTIQVALVGCGGRGTGAAENALSTTGPTRLVAMADVFNTRLQNSHGILQRAFNRQVDVPEARRFVGFDGYRRAMDALRPGDVVILATPPAFRWPQFTYAIEKRLHVFMEKPISVDGPSTRRMFALGEQAARANLKVGVGLMCRHCDARKDLERRIRDNQIGEINLMRAYRMAGPTATAFSFANPAILPDGRPNPLTELQYQIQRFHSFLWASGGAFSDFLIHNVDECCWMKNAWPVNAKASGGRHYRGKYVDQNFDTYSVEYTFADGAKLFLEGRCMSGAESEFASYAHGSRGSAIISRSGHSPCHARINRGQNPLNNDDVAWRWGNPRDEPNPYQLEWNHLMDNIRNNRAHNEVARGAEASLMCVMGRMAAHTGRIVTRDQALNAAQEFAPNVDRLTLDGPAPLLADSAGKYAVPQPGILTTREY
jgi:predicted dehydrogenase